MSARHPLSTKEYLHSTGTRTRVLLVLFVIAVLFVFSLVRGSRPLQSADDSQRELGEVAETTSSAPLSNVAFEQPSSPAQAPDASAGRLRRQPPGKLSLTIPPEFVNPDARAAPTGDQHVHDGDWWKKFNPDPPKQPPVARTSLTEIRPHQEWNVHQTAADSLGRIGVAAVPALVRALSNPDPIRRAEAAWMLGKIGPEAKQAVPALVQTLNDPLPSVQKAAARALGQIGPEAAEAVEALMRLVEQTEPIGVTPVLDEALDAGAQ